MEANEVRPIQAKDTIMPLEYSVLDSFHCRGISDKKILEALRKQAEISFKAGIREVVEWLKEHPNIGYGDYTEERCQLYQEWKAQLKEWENER